MIVNRTFPNEDFKEQTTFEEKVFWAMATDSTKDFLKQQIVVSRDRDCPYRRETLAYLKQNKIEPTSIVEVDTFDVLTAMVENNQAIAILPEKTIALNNQLQAIPQSTCQTVTIYVYSLKNNTIPFEIKL